MSLAKARLTFTLVKYMVRYYPDLAEVSALLCRSDDCNVKSLPV